MKEKEVVCAVILIDNLVYCCKRGKNVVHSGYWEFPGGQINPGEEKEEALVREIFEELNTIITVDEFLCTTEYVYPAEEDEEETKITLHAYKCTLIQGMLERKVHSEGIFMKLARLRTLKLLPPDAVVEKKVEEYFETHNIKE